MVNLFIYLVAVSHWFQHCTAHIMTGAFVGRGNQYIQLVKVLYCTLPTIGKQLPTWPHKVQGVNRRPPRWETSVLPLSHHCPQCRGRCTSGIAYAQLTNWRGSYTHLCKYRKNTCDFKFAIAEKGGKVWSHDKKISISLQCSTTFYNCSEIKPR